MSVKLLVVQGRPAGKSLAFPDGVYYIGRGAECHIRPNSEWVSRQHCVLRVAGLVATIRDLGSRNGTLVNGQLLDREQKLDEGDRIQVGPLVFEVRLEDSSTGGSPPKPIPTQPLTADETRAEEGKDRTGPYGTTAEIPILPPPPES
jgi:pSer/pThr/pTyr-binding forkhead associated (FHA) protein